MNKQNLINEIKTSFFGVKLGNGVGLWEAQGIDDYADSKTILTLRKKDERYDWSKIPFKDIEYCYSSMSFFDAEGMHFCLPQFLMASILEDELYKEEIYAPDLHLNWNKRADLIAYQKERFSLFNKKQTWCIVQYLEYKQDKIRKVHEEYAKNYGSTIDALYTDYEYLELKNTILDWKNYINENKN